jgi:hypothetical protein
MFWMPWFWLMLGPWVTTSTSKTSMSPGQQRSLSSLFSASKKQPLYFV